MPARRQPAGQRRTRLAGADDDRVERASWQRHHDQQRAADRDRVLDQRGGAVAAERRGEARANGASAERADHRADDAGDERRSPGCRRAAPIAPPDKPP